MTGFTKTAKVIELPDFEGPLNLIIITNDSERKLGDEIRSINLTSASLFHCRGPTVAVNLGKKLVIHCQNCGLRFCLPPTIQTIGDLQDFMEILKA